MNLSDMRERSERSEWASEQVRNFLSTESVMVDSTSAALHRRFGPSFLAFKLEYIMGWVIYEIMS